MSKLSDSAKVTCGDKRGRYLPAPREIECFCDECRPLKRTHTISGFEAHAGRGASKKPRQTIRIQGEKRSLGAWLTEHQGDWVDRVKAANKEPSEEDEGEEGDDQSITPTEPLQASNLRVAAAGAAAAAGKASNPSALRAAAGTSRGIGMRERDEYAARMREKAAGKRPAHEAPAGAKTRHAVHPKSGYLEAQKEARAAARAEARAAAVREAHFKGRTYTLHYLESAPQLWRPGTPAFLREMLESSTEDVVVGAEVGLVWADTEADSLDLLAVLRELAPRHGLRVHGLRVGDECLGGVELGVKVMAVRGAAAGAEAIQRGALELVAELGRERPWRPS